MKQSHRTLMNLLWPLLSVLWIVQGFPTAEDCRAECQDAAVGLPPDASETILLSSYFWPSPQGCCPEDLIAACDRCHLWDGYCTSSPILACERRCNPFINKWSPSHACSLCNQGARRDMCPSHFDGSVPYPRANSPVEQRAKESIRSYEPPPASLENSIPSPTVEPAEDVLPRNIIPTAKQTPDAHRHASHSDTATAPAAANKTTAAGKMPVKDVTAAAPVIRVEFAATPPEPETYDYHLPRSLRDAIRRSDGSPLSEQLKELSRSN